MGDAQRGCIGLRFPSLPCHRKKSMPYFAPMNCPWHCHQIGGPWISEDPSCPFHGSGWDSVDLGTSLTFR